MAKKILYQDNARRALERGMEIMVEAVSVTLGPVSYTHLRAHETRYTISYAVLWL